MDWRRIWVAGDLQLVWLHDASERVLEQVGILGGPEVYVERVQPVHVFSLVHGVGRGEAPCGGILLRAMRRTAAVARKAINSESE